VDWSIARWSWRLSDNGRERPTGPLSRLADLCPDPELSRLWREALELQNRYLKERELLRYLAALTPFSELPSPFGRPFQPEPAFRYDWLLHDAGRAEAAAVLNGPVADLERYAAGMAAVCNRLAARLAIVNAKEATTAGRVAAAEELVRGLRVTALRARHRALTIRALIARRKQDAPARKPGVLSERLLTEARAVRREAQLLVREQERGYRYPVELIARRGANLTAYPFGYLYPAAVLYFWEREEEQVRHERFDALFMNLWDVRRTLGLESLLFRN